LAAGGFVPAGVEIVAGCVLPASAGGVVLALDVVETGGFGSGVVTGGFGSGVGVTTEAVVTAAGGVVVSAEAEAEVVVVAVVPAAAATETAGPDAATTATPVARAVRWRRT